MSETKPNLGSPYYETTQSLPSSSFCVSCSSSSHQEGNDVLGTERTLFAALNSAWLLALGGVGYASAETNDQRPMLSDSFKMKDCESAERSVARTMDLSFESEDPRPPTPTRASSSRSHHEDFNLVLGMERTLFAALNNAWLLALGGIGLMSVGSGDQRATVSGIFVLASGIVNAIFAITMHFIRLHQIRNNRPCLHRQTVLWSTIIALMTIVTLALELHFGILYPYLDREKAVTIADGNPRLPILDPLGL